MVERMARALIIDLEPKLMLRLKRRTKRNGHTVEDEVRDILREALKTKKRESTQVGLGTRIQNRFKGIGLDFDIPEIRGQKARPATFD